MHCLDPVETRLEFLSTKQCKEWHLQRAGYSAGEASSALICVICGKRRLGG